MTLAERVAKGPACPGCGFSLRLRERDHRGWSAWCPNPQCRATEFGAPPNTELLSFVRERGAVFPTDAAEHFGWLLPNANNHLLRLAREGLVERERSAPRRGGKRFAYRIARPVSDEPKKETTT